ncbi:MAG TPA: uracil-DNA glycosylase, partial [Dehalococcoidia bacterium]|nr:uracil-DNA glycosylase [Dehalococcoidia bacterium]
SDCPNCELARERSQTVPGSGPVPCNLMLIGEAPGKNEDEQGLPFVGRSGKLLDQLLADIKLTRRDVYITNVVKCRPPENRDPTPTEVATCGDFLLRQIELVNPRVIVTLGKFAMARWFSGLIISKIRGQVINESGRWIMPVFHPAYVLRTRLTNLPLIQADFARIESLLQMPPPDESVRAETEILNITEIENR